MRRSLLFISLVAILAITGFSIARMIVLGQLDTFDADLNGWETGSSSPVPPMHVADGGPLGAGDGFMHATATGVDGPGGALVVFNTAQWAGDYTAAGVGSVSMDVKNLGVSDLDLRILVENGNARLHSTAPVHLPVGSGWVPVTFGLDSGSLTPIGAAVYAAVMSGVTRLRIYHSTPATFPAPAVDGELGVDNVEAGSTLPVELVSFTAIADNGVISLRWVTASETNNVGFDILEESGRTASFESVGFVAAEGDAARYSFSLARAVGDYRYRLRQVDVDGTATLSPIVEVSVAPQVFGVEAVYPNPTAGQATVDVLSPETRRVRLSVVDVLGREVRIVADAETTGARTQVSLDLGGLASGTYVLRAESGALVAEQAFVISK